MYDTHVMQILQSKEKVLHHIHSILFLVASFRLDPFEELSSLKILEDQVYVLIAFVYLIHLDDVLMIDHPEDIDLA